jgi:hypothetical protein
MVENGGRPTATPALGVSFQIILDKEGRRQIVFQTHVDQHTSLTSINAVLDKLSAAADRQIAKAELLHLEGEVDRELRNLTMFAEALEQLDARTQLQWEESGRRGSWSPAKLPPKQAAERDQTKGSLERTKSAIKLYQKRIEELKVIVGDGTPSTADCHPCLPDREGAGDGIPGGPEA